MYVMLVLYILVYSGLAPVCNYKPWYVTTNMGM
jgi:hypothetical protein